MAALTSVDNVRLCVHFRRLGVMIRSPTVQTEIVFSDRQNSLYQQGFWTLWWKTALKKHIHNSIAKTAIIMYNLEMSNFPMHGKYTASCLIAYTGIQQCSLLFSVIYL